MKNIALSFSGGGFRAAAYSLGCLSYLNQLQFDGGPLLKKVTFISSTSGGSITNLLYSISVFKGEDFEQFYKELEKVLQGEELLTKALQNLNDPEAWKVRNAKSQNLINAFSLVYDEILRNENFGLFSDRSKNPHIEEICITSTEFTNGLPFRFQSQHPDKDFPKGEIGNFYINFENIEDAKKIKLADILASSSCFPTGFEPMIFPNDYANKDVGTQDLQDAISYKANEFTLKDKAKEYNNIDFFRNENYSNENQFGIMDGGVTDNQAIDAFLKADERRERNRKDTFDLYLSCDVSSYFMNGFTLPTPKHQWLNILNLNVLTLLFVVASMWLPILLIAKSGVWEPWEYITGTISGMFFLPLFILIVNKMCKNIFKTKSKTDDSWGIIIKKHKGSFKKMGLGKLYYMILSRAKSVFILGNDIFLKQVRRMYYDQIFSDEKYNKRVIQNAIYTLSKAKFSGHDISTDPLHPSNKMIEVAEKARTMGTTLWFDENHERDDIRKCIIATGRFTTCYSLFDFLRKLDVSSKTSELIELEKKLLSDYNEFLNDPFINLN